MSAPTFTVERVDTVAVLRELPSGKYPTVKTICAAGCYSTGVYARPGGGFNGAPNIGMNGREFGFPLCIWMSATKEGAVWFVP